MKNNAEQDQLSRMQLAWYSWLRKHGWLEPANTSDNVLGIVAEMPTSNGFDIIAIYADHSMMMFMHDVSAVVVEPGSATTLCND